MTIVHFYHLSALDWVDVTSALKADPDKAAALGESLSSWHLNSKHEMRASMSGSSISSMAASWAFSPTATGATRR
jgi:Ni,Fe-hydrogenase I large subunit